MIRVSSIDKFFIGKMHLWGVPVLRVVLGVVFFWFGALKVLGESPVAELVETAYGFLPQAEFVLILGLWEMLIGLGLIFRFALRFVLALLWLQMAGTLLSPLLAPSLFFTSGNPLFLTVSGEFIVKNLVLIASSLVVGGYEVKPATK